MGAAIPLIISAVSAGVGAMENRRVLKAQDDALAQGIAGQAVNQRQADQEVGTAVEGLAQSTPEGAREKATGDFLAQLRRNRAQATPGAVPGGSSRYRTDVAGADREVADFGAQAADTLARINAPAMQREAEGVASNRLSTNLGLAGRNSAADQFLTQLRVNSIRANPWVGAGAQIGQGVASGMASRAPRGSTGNSGFSGPRP